MPNVLIWIVLPSTIYLHLHHHPQPVASPSEYALIKFNLHEIKPNKKHNFKIKLLIACNYFYFIFSLTFYTPLFLSLPFF